MNLVVASVLLHNSECVSLEGPQQLVDASVELGLRGQVKYYENYFIVVLEGGLEALGLFKSIFIQHIGEGDFYEHLNVSGRHVEPTNFQLTELVLHDPKWLNNDALECFIRLYQASIQWPQVNHLIDMLCLVFASEHVEDYLYPPTSLSEAYAGTGAVTQAS